MVAERGPGRRRESLPHLSERGGGGGRRGPATMRSAGVLSLVTKAAWLAGGRRRIRACSLSLQAQGEERAAPAAGDSRNSRRLMPRRRAFRSARPGTAGSFWRTGGMRRSGQFSRVRSRPELDGSPGISLGPRRRFLRRPHIRLRGIQRAARPWVAPHRPPTRRRANRRP